MRVEGWSLVLWKRSWACDSALDSGYIHYAFALNFDGFHFFLFVKLKLFDDLLEKTFFFVTFPTLSYSGGESWTAII